MFIFGFFRAHKYFQQIVAVFYLKCLPNKKCVINPVKMGLTKSSIYYFDAAEPTSSSAVRPGRVVTTNYYLKRKPTMIPASKINFISNFIRRLSSLSGLQNVMISDHYNEMYVQHLD